MFKGEVLTFRLFIYFVDFGCEEVVDLCLMAK